MEEQFEQNIEGVTLNFHILHSKFENVTTLNFYVGRGKSKSIDSLETISSNLLESYKHIQDTYGVKAKSKIMWGSLYGTDSHLIINLRGNPAKLEKALEHIIGSYGFPTGIYIPNKFFENSDTEKGVEIAKEVILKQGGKVKRCGTLSRFTSDSYQKHKYDVSENKK